VSPAKHIIASGATSLFFYALTNSWTGSVACFFGGIVIDVDHLLDFYCDKKRMCWSLKEMNRFCLDERHGKMYMVFHSYELLVVLWVVLVVVLHFEPIAFGFVFGMSARILFDQFTNAVYPLAYFWFCRRRFGFTKKIFFGEDFAREFTDR